VVSKDGLMQGMRSFADDYVSVRVRTVYVSEEFTSTFSGSVNKNING